MSEKRLQHTHYARCNTHYEKGFSLAEVLMSLGILSIGMLLIAAIFPAGVYFATISTERTIAAVVADEAFAKIRLYGVDVNLPPLPMPLPAQGCVDFSTVPIKPIATDEFLYPSDPDPDLDKFYCWSALCRRVLTDLTGRSVQVTVFVSRMAGAAATYYLYNGSQIVEGPLGHGPAPVLVEISVGAGNPITIENQDYRTFLTEGCTIVDGKTGFIYRVLRRDDADPYKVYLDKDFIDIDSDGKSDVWVVPHPVGGGRAPCIAVYQKIIRF